MQAITTMQWVSTFEEQAVRKPLYSRPPQLVMHGLKAQGTSCDYLYRRIHSQRKPQAKVRVNAFVPREGFLSGLHPLRVSRRPAASLLLKQARPDLLPWNDFIRIALVLPHAIVQLIALAVRQ
jgi:hypothetical protein